MTTKDRYLDLLKQALSFSLWEDSGYPLEANNHLRSAPKRLLVILLSRIAGMVGWQIVVPPPQEERDSGFSWPRHAHTMIGRHRLDNIQKCVESVLDDGILGDLIETGVWRGGASIFMRGILAAHEDAERRVFVADSFAGLPPPDPEKYPADAGDECYRLEFLQVSEEQVRENFAKFGLLDEQVVFLKGWFKDTLPVAPIEKLAVMRLDGDMYESTMDALTALYGRLSPGGYCIIDDYALDTCRQAVDDFRERQQITEPLEKIDWTGVYWRKGA